MAFYNPKLYLRDYWIGPVFLGCIVIQIAVWWYLLANIHPSTEQIFLHYNTVFGIDLVGDWWKIFYLPAGGLLVMFVNYLVSWYFYSSDKFLARVLSLWTGVINIFLAIAVYLIAGLNL